MKLTKSKLKEIVREEIQKLNEKNDIGQEVVYMAPKGNAKLKKYNEKLAVIVGDEGKNVTIKFKDGPIKGKMLTVVPKRTQLRYLEMK
jgi:hypothetical protein